MSKVLSLFLISETGKGTWIFDIILGETHFDGVSKSENRFLGRFRFGRNCRVFCKLVTTEGEETDFFGRGKRLGIGTGGLLSRFGRATTTNQSWFGFEFGLAPVQIRAGFDSIRSWLRFQSELAPVPIRAGSGFNPSLLRFQSELAPIRFHACIIPTSFLSLLLTPPSPS